MLAAITPRFSSMSAPDIPFGPLRARQLRGALNGPFDLDLQPGRCCVISGPSGIGKSLLLRLLADLDPNSGEVSLAGIDRQRLPASIWRRHVCLVASDAGWWEERVASHFSDTATARALLPALGIEADRFDAPVAQLSSGERQRLALLRAIVLRPRFLLLDEPTSALDPENTARVEAVLSQLREQGTGLLVVSHSPEQTERLADQRLLMGHDGLHEVPR